MAICVFFFPLLSVVKMLSVLLISKKQLLVLWMFSIAFLFPLSLVDLYYSLCFVYFGFHPPPQFLKVEAKILGLRTVISSVILTREFHNFNLSFYFCLVSNIYFLCWFLLGPVYYLKVNYLVSKYLGIINIYLLLIFNFIHCGQKIYFIYFKSFYICWDSFHGLAYCLCWNMSHVPLRRICFLLLWWNILYRLFKVGSLCSVLELLGRTISEFYRWFYFSLCASTAFCLRLWLWSLGGHFLITFQLMAAFFYLLEQCSESSSTSPKRPEPVA